MSSLNTETADKKPSRLGRGLSSLLGDIETPSKPAPTPAPAPVAPEAKSNYRMMALDKIIPNPNQPRKTFSQEKLTELSASIKIHGIIQPIVVSSLKDGKYQIIAGERRWRASQMAGLKEVPVIFQEVDDEKSLELAIIENIQRQDLNPVEEAKAYLQLIKKFGLTQNEVAEKVGKERATVANTLRILTLEPEILDFIANGQLSLGHAKVLLGLENKIRQRLLARRSIDQGLSVRALEKIINEPETATVDASESAKKTNIHCEALAQELQKNMGTKVKIDYQNGKGSITIQFYSDDQLNEIANKIRGV